MLARGKKGFRHYMDGIKWWFVMGQTHDGGFVPMPGRDYASTDHVYATRVMPSAIAALILSVKERKLQITGASSIVPPASENESGSENTGQLQAPKADKPSQASLILGSDFVIKHCQAQARMLEGSTPYPRVFDGSMRLLPRVMSRQQKQSGLPSNSVPGWPSETTR